MAIGGLVTGIFGILFSLAWIGLFVLGSVQEPGDLPEEEIDVEIPNEKQNEPRNDDSDPASEPSPDRNDQQDESQ